MVRFYPSIFLISLEQTKKDEVRTPKPAPKVNSEPVEQEDDENLTEEQRMLKLVDKKIASAVRLAETDCLFCTKKFEDFDR